MKKIMIAAIVALSSSFAVAGALDAAQYDYSDAGTPAAVKPCVNGTTQVVMEQHPFLDRQVAVTRICVNGSFNAHVTPRKCKEGAFASWTVQNSINDRSHNVTYVCKAGKWIPASF